LLLFILLTNRALSTLFTVYALDKVPNFYFHYFLRPNVVDRGGGVSVCCSSIPRV